MARMLSFPAGVNTSAVAAQICSLSFWDRHKFILTISRGMDVRCFIYKVKQTFYAIITDYIFFLPIILCP